MNTLNKLAYDLAETVDRENDYAFVRRMKDHVIAYRSLFFRRDQSRGNRLPVEFIQDLGCLDMKKVPSVECCGIDLGCTIYRTVEKVPRPIRTKIGEAFTYVGTIDGKNPFTQSTRVEASFRSFDRFRNVSEFYVYENGYIYVFNVKPDKISVKGVFADPREVTAMGYCEVECFDDDSEFPMAEDMAPGLLLAIKREVLGLQTPDEDNQKIEVDEKQA